MVVADILEKFGIDGVSSTQVSRASKLLDHDLEHWRNRPLGEIRYLILDARYEKVQIDGVVRDATILSAIGIGPECRGSLLGVSIALSFQTSGCVIDLTGRGCDFCLHSVPNRLFNLNPVEPGDFLQAGGRGHIDLGQVIADHIDAHENHSLLPQ